MKNLTFTQAIKGYRLACEARRLSENTVRDYMTTYGKFCEWLENQPNPDPFLIDIDRKMIQAFLASQTSVSDKTLLNYHTGLSALWTWAIDEGYAYDHIIRKVERPSPEQTVINPFTEKDARALLGALERSRSYARRGQVSGQQHALPNAERNKAIILMLLDTGMRASELCALKIFELDMKNRRVEVFGKGKKKRILPFSARTGQAIWRYLALRKEDSAGDPLFSVGDARPMDRNRLYKLLAAIGKRAGVEDCHPHRFRHTFAITFLRNGGDPYSLQMLLGHTTMEMTRKYLAIAEADIEVNHRRASPVDNWQL